MIYARVHDATAAEDYYRAMAEVERRLDLNPDTPVPAETITAPERVRLLHLVSRLAEPQLDLEGRLHLVREMRSVLSGADSHQMGPPLPPEL